LRENIKEIVCIDIASDARVKKGMKCHLNNLARNTRIILGKMKPGATKEGCGSVTK